MATELGSSTAFIEELRNEVRRESVIDGPHPFTQMMVKGELTVEQLQMWATQFYLRTQAFSRGVAYMFAKCPSLAFRREIAANLYEEETGRISGTMPHVELFAVLAESIGVTREQLDSARPASYTRAFSDYIESMASMTFEEILGAIAIAAEAQTQDGVSPLTSRLQETYGADTSFFDLHVVLDEDHSDLGDQVIHDMVQTEDARARVARAVHRHNQEYNKWLDGLFEEAVAHPAPRRPS